MVTIETEAQKKGLTTQAAGLETAGLLLGSIGTQEKVIRKLKVAGVGALVGTGLGIIGVPAVTATVGGLFAIEEVKRLKEIGQEPFPQVRKLKFAEEVTDIGAALIGSGLGGAVGTRLVPPRKVKVTVPRTRDVILAEEIAGTTKTQKLLFEAEQKVKVARTRVEAFLQEVKPPRDPQSLADFIGREDIRFGITTKEGVPKTALFLDVPSKIRKFRTEPEVFEIKGEGVRRVTDEVSGKDVILTAKESVERLIDPTKFEVRFREFEGQKFGEAVLERTRALDGITPFKTSLLAAVTKVKEVFVKKRVQVPDVFGIGQQLVPPQEILFPVKHKHK